MDYKRDIIYYINRVYEKNLTTTSGGNLSEMDSNGNIFITPSGKDKGTLREEDICMVRPDGTLVGEYKPSIELPFHTLLYKLRPDVKAVLHVHSPMLVTYSLFNKAPITDIIPFCYEKCGAIGLSRYDIPGSIELGQQIAKIIEQGYDSIMMENHGVVIVADTMRHAYDKLEALENAANICLKATMIGGKMNRLSIDEMNRATNRRADYKIVENEPLVSEEERAIRESIVKFSKRCYIHDFFEVGYGSISVKIDDHSFLITPEEFDRKELLASQIIKVTDGVPENGRPDKDFMLHYNIYSKKPYAKSIMTAIPPNIMAYAVTGTEINSRTIPESYINMRDVVRLPYLTDVENEDRLISSLSPASPIVLVENSKLITTGETIVKAFDRLEVTEVTAKTLVLSHILGTPTNISDEEIDKIDKTFNLPPLE